MLVQIFDTENGLIEIKEAICFSQTHARYSVTYRAGAGMVRVFAIKKENVKAVYINNKRYTGVNR